MSYPSFCNASAVQKCKSWTLRMTLLCWRNKKSQHFKRNKEAFNWPQEGARESLWQSPDTCRAFKNHLFSSSITLNVITLVNKMSKSHLFLNAPGSFLFNFTFLHDFWSQKPQNTSHTMLSVFIVNTASIVLECQTSFCQTLCTKRVWCFNIFRDR